MASGRSRPEDFDTANFPLFETAEFPWNLLKMLDYVPNSKL